MRQAEAQIACPQPPDPCWARIIDTRITSPLDALPCKSAKQISRLDVNHRTLLKFAAAWNSKSAVGVASFFAEDGEIVINRGEPWKGRGRTAEMAAGFFADVPDMSLTCDETRCAGSHAVYVWTFDGHDAKTGNPLKVQGWEEWDLDDDLRIRSSPGWNDAEDYASQVAKSA